MKITRILVVVAAASSMLATTPQTVHASGLNSPMSAVAPQGKVTGTVVDANGEPVIGANVSTLDGKVGTVTDIDGRFSLDVALGTQLRVSFIGYVPAQIKAASSMNVVLSEDYQGLDETVVIGYGAVKKRDLTGSVASVKSGDISKAPTHNVADAIQGQVAGLDITHSDGELNSDMNIILRGYRSINGDNSPLFIIDGMEGSFSELNPSDIASVEVLKDASSTAIYGAAGANGVIIITTKNAQKGKFNVSLDSYYGFNMPREFPKIRMGEDYLNYEREKYRAAGKWSSTADDQGIFDSTTWGFIQNNQWIDWADIAVNTGSTTNHTLGMSFANDRLQSYTSVGYYKINGQLDGEQFTRYSMRSKIDLKVNSFLKLGTNIYAMYSNQDKRSSRIWNRILCTTPLGQAYNEDGSVCLDVRGDGTVTNPLADSEENQYANNTKTISIQPQVYAELTPLKGMTFKSVLGGYFRNSKNAEYNGTKSYESFEHGNVYANVPNNLTYNYKWQNILTYNFQVMNDHDITLTGVTEWSKNCRESVTARANGFDSDDVLYHNLSTSTGVPTVSSGYTQNQMMSYAARFNYSYKGRYLLTLTGRWDGASQLAEGNKWDFFPAGALAWRISDEAFMEPLTAVNNAKLRVSYGVTGNAGASEYATMAYSRSGVYGMQDVATNYSGYSTNVVNPNLGWEKSYSLDLGLDLGLFRDRINLSADWYRTDTKDVLYQMGLPYAQGGYGGSSFSMWSNIGEIRNSGVELLLNTRNIAKKHFTWNTTITLAYNHEEVIKTTQEDPLKFGNYYLIPGEAIHTYYGYKYAGIWGMDEAEEAAKYGQVPGEIHTLDANGDGKINTDDYQVLGNATPKWTAGMTNSFTLGDFDFSFLLIGRWDYKIAYGIAGWEMAEIRDYWTPENQDARFPRPNANGTKDYGANPALLDGDYWKLKNITFGWTCPKKWLRSANIENARVYMTADNLFIQARSKYIDHYDIEKGGDDDYAPMSRQFVFGVNLTF